MPDSLMPDSSRLSMETRLSLREVSDLIGEKGHSVIWATNFEVRNGLLPTASQIVIGLERDLGVKVSTKSAERALNSLRGRPFPTPPESGVHSRHSA